MIKQAFILFILVLTSCKTVGVREEGGWKLTPIKQEHGLVLSLGLDFYEKKENKFSIILPYGGINSAVKIEKNGILYTIGYDKENRITYIGSSDDKFEVQGNKVGDSLDKSILDRSYKPILGGGGFIPLDFGWFIIYKFDDDDREKASIIGFCQYMF